MKKIVFYMLIIASLVLSMISCNSSGDVEDDGNEVIEDDPDYFECYDCDEECDVCETDDGVKYYRCPNCDMCYDENGNEFNPYDEEDE